MVTLWEGRFRILRRLTLFAGALLGILIVVGAGLAIYSARALSKFERVEARRSTLLYAAPPVLRPGVSVGGLDLAGILGRLGYRETRAAAGPGQFSRSDSAWDIYVGSGAGGAGRVNLTLSGGRITRLSRNGTEVQSVALPPELLASAGAGMGESIRPVRLPDVPPVLRTAVLAIEDERFYEHGGLDPRGVLRALWANVRKGRVVEGGSTITQQLVKNAFLSPRRTLWRSTRSQTRSKACMGWMTNGAPTLQSSALRRAGSWSACRHEPFHEGPMVRFALGKSDDRLGAMRCQS